jgi:hypothetical protein
VIGVPARQADLTIAASSSNCSRFHGNQRRLDGATRLIQESQTWNRPLDRRSAGFARLRPTNFGAKSECCPKNSSAYQPQREKSESRTIFRDVDPIIERRGVVHVQRSGDWLMKITNVVGWRSKVPENKCSEPVVGRVESVASKPLARRARRHTAARHYRR